MIKHVKGGYQVVSSKGRNLGGPYKTLEAAQERLRQVEFFKGVYCTLRPPQSSLEHLVPPARKVSLSSGRFPRQRVRNNLPICSDLRA